MTKFSEVRGECVVVDKAEEFPHLVGSTDGSECLDECEKAIGVLGKSLVDPCACPETDLSVHKEFGVDLVGTFPGLRVCGDLEGGNKVISSLPTRESESVDIVAFWPPRRFCGDGGNPVLILVGESDD